jgi:hypothetical protein
MRSNAATALESVCSLRTAAVGCERWKGAAFDGGDGGGGGFDRISSWRLLEAAVDDGAQHQRGEQWRRSRSTLGYDSGGWQWPMAEIGDDKGGGGGGGESVLFFMKLNSSVGKEWGQG